MSWEELTAEMNRKMQFPGWTNAWTMPIKTRVDMLTTGVRTPVGIKVFGQDLKSIEAVGEDLLTIAATVLSAESKERTAGRHEAWDLAEEFFRNARERINRNIRELLRNHDRILTVIGTRALHGDYPSLSSGIIRRGLNEYLPKDKR